MSSPTKNPGSNGRAQGDRDIVRRYQNQPAEMPTVLRDRIEAACGGETLEIYALADLDAGLNLTATWIALSRSHFAVVRVDGDPTSADIRVHPRAAVESVREVPGLSANVLSVLGAPDEPPLATLRFTHRQRRAMENVKFLLENKTAPDEVILRDADELYSGAMAKSVRDAQASVAGHRFAVIWRLLAFVKPYKTRLTIGMIAAVFMTAMSLIPPALIGYLIDNVVKPYYAGDLTRAAAGDIAFWIVMLLAGAYVMREFCLWVRLRAMSVLGEYIARDLRRALYTHLQKLSLSFYSSKQTGSIITRVSSDTDRLWDFVAFGLVEVSLAVIMLLGLGTVLIVFDWQLGLLMVAPVPLLIWAFFRHGRLMKRLFLRAFRKWSSLTEVLSDTIPGMRVVKAFNQEDNETERFNNRNTIASNEFISIHTVWTRFWPGLMLSIHMMTVIVWAVALPRLLSGPSADAASLSLGTFTSFLFYMGMFFAPIETIGMITRMLNRATSSAIRIFEILDTQPDLTDDAKPVQLEPVEGRVKFDNVSFAYDRIRPVIHEMSFDVEPGEMIGLVGPSGSGKTTITNLLVRFYDVTAGRILIDGVDLRHMDIGHFRRQVGMVLQDPHLFHGSILANIRYGVRAATLSDVIRAAKAANAHEFICKLPHGYDTVVGERGHTLSGGERQRISIARAILSNPQILILDEATSSVDTETERKIQEALDRLVRGRTVFAIAHRLSTLRRADRLFVIDKGRIAEQGSHAELLEREGGIYRKLHRLQQELHEMYAV